MSELTNLGDSARWRQKLNNEHLALQIGDTIKCQGYPTRFIVRYIHRCDEPPFHVLEKPYDCGGTHYIVEEINPQGVLHRFHEYSQTWIDLHYQRLENITA